MQIGCVVKAAGKSKRFGGENKLLADLGGKQVLAHVLDALPRECLSHVVVVVSDQEVDALCHARGIKLKTVYYPGGPVSESIKLGLNKLLELHKNENGTSVPDGCMFVAGDQPLLTRESCFRLLATFEKSGNCVCRLAFDKTPGAPVIFPRRLFKKLLSLTGEKGGMSAVKGEEIKLVDSTCCEELWDADTPEALDEIRRVYAENY